MPQIIIIFVLMSQVLLKNLRENLIFPKIMEKINHFLNFLNSKKDEVEVFSFRKTKNYFYMKPNLIKKIEFLLDGYNLDLKIKPIAVFGNIDYNFQRIFKK
jgi:hypothetical protein